MIEKLYLTIELQSNAILRNNLNRNLIIVKMKKLLQIAFYLIGIILKFELILISN